ncbi:hypothetical protein AC249_AIPGENE121 [Exaiptasia diaphana]|nr:hypothetical protein AC249_AIPGENE121 [Exaiptasia diaphana]
MGCGGLGPPSIVGSSAPRNKDHDKSCAYCHRDTDQCNEENWHQNDLKCFKFFLDTKASWDDASRTCAQEGGNLGVFGRKGGLHFVTDFVQSRNKSNEQIMVGLRQNCRKKTRKLIKMPDGKDTAPKNPMTKEDSSRIQSTQPNPTEKGSFAARAQAAADKRDNAKN